MDAPNGLCTCNGTMLNGTSGYEPRPNGTAAPGIPSGRGSAVDGNADDMYNSWDDATWILTSAFVIFTMQSGFGLLESGMVSRKNEVNIMVKNAVDVIFGGMTYWVFGYGFSFGTGPGSNPFCGIGHFFTDSTDPEEMGWIFAKFVFQASFATTATTIVSGAMAERTKLEAYCVFSLVNTLIYCFPAHWIWSENGIFAQMGAIDIAGAGAVHLVGGTTGLVATLMLKPRRGRFTGKGESAMSNPTNALLGMFMLWWGWLGFNCGSTFGISGGKWKLATRAAMSTLLASSGGGLAALAISWIARPSGRKFDIGYLNNGVLGGLVGITGEFMSAMVTITSSIGGGITGLAFSWITLNRKFNINCLINGVLGALVGSTAICALAKPWEGLVIGVVGGSIAVYTPSVLERLKIDDPVGVIGVHLLASVWGLAAVGIFGKPDKIENITDEAGLLYGGGFHLLGVQLLMALTLFVWTIITAYILLFAISRTIGLRCSVQHEILGLDICEHGINQLSPEECQELTKELHSLGLESPFDCPSPRVRLRSAGRRRSYAPPRSPSVATVAGVIKSVEDNPQLNTANSQYLMPKLDFNHTEVELANQNWILMEDKPKSEESPKTQTITMDAEKGADNPAFVGESQSRTASPITVDESADSAVTPAV